MSTVSCLPEDVLSSVFDELEVLQLLAASHVCQSWRIIAINHKTFWGTAVIAKCMTRPVLDFFLSRLAQARLRLGPIAITVLPDLRPPRTQEQLTLLKMTIAPALSTALSHIVSLRLEVPSALVQPMFDALRQPAPVLRRFDITNWQSKTPVCVPLDIFANSAPQLTELILGDGVHLPDHPVSGFQSVELLVFLVRSGIVGLTSIRDLFPSLRHLDMCARELPRNSLSRLTADQISQFGRLESLGLHVTSLDALQRLGVAKGIITLTRHFRLHLVPLNRPHEPFSTDLSASTAALFLPPSREELYGWMHWDGTLLAYPAESPGPLFMRHTYGLYGARDPGPAFGLFTAYPTLVALSVEIEMWDDLRECTAALPALEVVVIAFSMRLQLPWRMPPGRLIPTPRLRTAILHCRPRWEGVPPIAGPVTCRNVDSFLRATFDMDDWTRVEGLLINVRLYGAATVPGTKISSVRVASTEECCALGPRVATLLRHIGHVGRPLV